MKDKINRRQFFSLNLGTTVSFLENLLVSQIEHDLERDFFRPPGTENELDFLTSCDRCGLCKENCPEEIIKLFTPSAGAKLVSTPYINPNESPCTFCYKCAEVCPTGALQHEVTEKIGLAELDKQKCLAYQDVLCNYCVYACPVKGAIHLNYGRPVVNQEYCTGCGVCVSNCIAEVKGIHITLQN